MCGALLVSACSSGPSDHETYDVVAHGWAVLTWLVLLALMIAGWKVIHRRIPRLPTRLGRIMVTLFGLGVVVSLSPLSLIIVAPDNPLVYVMTNRLASIGAWLIFGTMTITLIALIRALFAGRM